MSGKTRRKFAITVSVIATLIAVPSFSASPLTAYQNQGLNWKSCGSGLECTTFKVPLDYSAISSKSFTLAVVRHKATNTNQRIGTLFVNPGGPGGSAFDYASAATRIVSKKIAQRYDIVGFDPRGVGKSEPIRCLSDAEEDSYLSADTAVLTKNDLNSLLSRAKFFALKCAEPSHNKIAFVGTVDNARDMELLRQILKEPRLNFLGKSYGTYLGTLYAALYPTKVGRFVLDGAVDPNASSGSQNLGQAISFDKALLDYQNKSKSFTQQKILAFINSLYSKPLQLPSGRKLTASMAIVGIAASLYDNANGWPTLTSALDAAINKGDARPLIDLSDIYNRRDANGHYSNENDISQAISCLDISDTRSVSQMTSDGSVMKVRAPVFGPFLTYAGLACKYWKYPPSAKPSTKLILTNPIMIIGVTKDPATPYSWAKKLQLVFKKSSLVTFVGEGHTGHNRGNKCVDIAVDSYLLQGILTKSITCTS